MGVGAEEATIKIGLSSRLKRSLLLKKDFFSFGICVLRRVSHKIMTENVSSVAKRPL